MIIKTVLLFSLISLAFCYTYSFESLAYPHEFIRHRDWFGVISKIDNTPMDKKGATFIIAQGLADPDNQRAISFESVNHPGYVLRRGTDSRIHLTKHKELEHDHDHVDTHHSVFDKEATFYIEDGNLNHEDRETCSFSSFIDRSSFIRARDHVLFVEPGSDYKFHKESTFFPMWQPEVAHAHEHWSDVSGFTVDHREREQTGVFTSPGIQLGNMTMCSFDQSTSIPASVLSIYQCNKVECVDTSFAPQLPCSE